MSEGRVARSRPVLAVGLAGLALACLPAAAPAVRAAAFAAGFAFLPGALLAPWLVPQRGRATRALLALTLSPFLVGAPAAAMIEMGMETRTVAVALLVAILAGAGLRLLRPPAAPPAEGAAVWVVALAWAVLCATLLGGNPWLAPRLDGWFHAAVTLQIAERGVPPEDPFFAGLRLLYFWGAHAWGALWLALEPRLAPWTPMVVLVVSGALATLLGVGLIARRLGAGPRGIAVAGILAAVGYQPFGWAWGLARGLVGQTRGSEDVRALAGGGIAAAYQAIGFGVLHPSLSFFGDKFLIATPFALGLALFAAFVLAFVDLVERPTWRAGITLALVEAAALFVHSIVGWTCALVAAAWWCWAAWRARRAEERRLVRALPAVFAAFVAAIMLLAPYLAATTLGKQQQLGPGLASPVLTSWLLAGGLFVPAGIAWLARHGRSSGPARELFGLAVALTLAALFLGLPHDNQSKLFNLLFLLLAAPAALGWLALRDRLRGAARAGLVALLAVATLPTAALAVWGFATESSRHGAGWQVAPDADERAAWAWARAHLPADAVFVAADGRLDMTVFAGRSTLFGNEPWAHLWGHPSGALRLRQEAAAALAAGRAARVPLPAREVVVVVRRDALESGLASPAPRAGARFEPPRFVPIFRNPGIALYRYREAT